MRNRSATILLIAIFLLLIYALAQNGGLTSITNLFQITPGGTTFFGFTPRPVFPTAGSGGFFPAPTLPPAYPTPFNAPIFGTPGSNDPNSSYAGSAGCVIPNGWTAYTIQNGDTIGTIASTYNVPLAQFIAANCLANPDLIYAGQIVFVPGPGAVPLTPLP